VTLMAVQLVRRGDGEDGASMPGRPIAGFAKVAYPRTARIICDGMVYIKNERPPEATA
jgi:hypothetical protein